MIWVIKFCFALGLFFINSCSKLMKPKLSIKLKGFADTVNKLLTLIC